MTFNPSNHLRKIERRQRQQDGSFVKVANDYLDVKWRLVWLRQEQPDASISTELLTLPGESPAVVKATVTLPTGVSTTGLGQCGAQDWGDWLEKAETRAIGRALAALGFGTQFCQDFDDIITDAPVDADEYGRGGTANAGTHYDARPASRAGGNTRKSMANPGEPITANQRRFVESLARNAGLDFAGLVEVISRKFDKTLDDLTKAEASSLIESLQAMENESSMAGFAGGH